LEFAIQRFPEGCSMFRQITLGLIGLSAISAQAQTSAPLTLDRTITLPGVTGKFDHFAIDETGNRLFAAAGGSHAAIVIDLSSGKIAQVLPGIGKPHGVAWIEKTGRLFVADGGKAELDVFEGSPLKKIKSIPLSDDADDMVYDSATKLLYVGHGGGDAANPAAVAVVDTEGLALVATLPVSSHPEALELHASGHRIFANIADTGEIAVIDGNTHTIADKWPLSHEKGNTPLAYDAADDLLLIGCRTPAKLLVLNGKTGKQIASVASDTGADDLFYDPASHYAYLITGSGSINSYSVSPDGQLRALAVTKTTEGAKTGLLVPSRGELFVGVPGTSSSSEIRIYKIAAK
jgi:hypothetical protein